MSNQQVNPADISTGNSWIIYLGESLQDEVKTFKYNILLTKDYPKGPIGQIALQNAHDGTVYALNGPQGVLEVHEKTGQLTILVNAGQLDPLVFYITASYKGKEIAKIIVEIVELDLNYGDQFATDAIDEARKQFEKDKVISGATVFIPAALDVLLQQVAESDPVNHLSEAETIVEKTIQLVHTKIIKEFGRWIILQNIFF